MSAAEMREAAVRAARRRAATHDDDSPAATLAELIALDIAALPLPDEKGMVERVAADVWDAVANLAASGTPSEGILAIAKGNSAALRAPLPDEEGMVERVVWLLNEGLNLCARARKLDEQVDHMLRREMGDQSPEVTRSATPHLWVQEQYQRDLEAWETEVRAALRAINGGEL